MSAWMHGNYHLSAVVNTMYGADYSRYPWWNTGPQKGAKKGDPMYVPVTAEEAFLVLQEANAQSIARYYSHHGETVASNIADSEPYLPPDQTDTLNPVTCAKAISSIDYQSCGYEGWEASLARRLLQAMKEPLLTSILRGTEHKSLEPIRKDAWDIRKGSA